MAKIIKVVCYNCQCKANLGKDVPIPLTFNLTERMMPTKPTLFD
ncbi:MAG: hypothetical protein WAR39_04630 [Prevotella sp.]